MDIEKLFETLDKNDFIVALQQSSWAFQAIETIHVLAFSIVVGTIGVVDSRLLGISSRSIRVTQMAGDYLRWTWAAFALAAMSGVLLFVTKSSIYFSAAPFRWKLALLVLAGVNMAVFHFGIFRSVDIWDIDQSPPLAARIAGGISLSLWICIIFLGRWIGFAIVEV